jgi:hypothetical protein
MLTAMRRASSRVSCLKAVRRVFFILKVHIGERFAVGVADAERLGRFDDDQGDGKRRFFTSFGIRRLL